MKTNYLKSIGLILFGAAISFFLSLSIEKTKASETYPIAKLNSALVLNSSLIQSTECTAAEENQECLPKALENLSEYRMWLKYLPKILRIDTNTYQLTFDGLQIAQNDRAAMKKILKSYWGANEGFRYPKLPFQGVKDHAFFMKKQDILNAFSLVQGNNSENTANGVRIYMASEGLMNDTEASIKSLLYVVPTYEGTKLITNNGKSMPESIDFIPSYENGEKYVFNLSNPCPENCDVKSQLNLSDE